MPTTNGSNNDMIVAYVVRFVMLGALSFLVKTSMQSRDILIKGDIPQMQKDIQELKLQGQKYITADQLRQAVRIQMLEELSRKPVTTDVDGGKHYEH